MSEIEVDEFQAGARGWLAANKQHAPATTGRSAHRTSCDRGSTGSGGSTGPATAGIHWPTEYGGQGLTIAHTAAWQYECAVAAVPSVFNMVGLVLAGGALLQFGTPEQKATHLHETLRANHVWCQLFSEPGAGSDLGGLSTRAERDGDRFLVNGQKVWTSGGRYSNWGILMARTNADAPKHEGISFFAFPMHLPGVEIRPLKQMTGEAEFDEVFFTDVELPADHLLGPLHGGWGVGMAVLTSERGHGSASTVGLERRMKSMSSLGAGRSLDSAQRQRLTKLVVNAARPTRRWPSVRDRSPPRRRRCSSSGSPR